MTFRNDTNVINTSSSFDFSRRSISCENAANPLPKAGAN